MEQARTETAQGILERQVPGMGSLSGFLKSDVANSALVIGRAKGTVLFDPGSSCGGMLLLDRGLIRVSNPGPRGRELTLYRVSPTQICVITLSCVLSETSYPARGVVERDIHGVLLPVALFRRMTDEVPAFRSYVFDSFTSRLAELIDLASAVTFEHLDTRLAAFLLRKCEAHHSQELELTHQDLAAELGTVRERVSRLLENLEAEGVVELGRGRVRVVDCDRLRALSDSNG